MTAQELIRKAEDNGWREVRRVGSHRIFKKEGKVLILSVPDHGHKDLKPGLLGKLLKIIHS
ncbi:type II toxin-antitoxin system HicA family toxin [Spirosoma endbachense]|uniref:Addiction module toxin, HicA family n=1 Tax=Spirosoma endbachense TaxID=2666025 RepID=A0A6P1W1K9_9BACT|nr:addiction module toxin, HicA family [Spirosoma endbachense]